MATILHCDQHGAYRVGRRRRTCPDCPPPSRPRTTTWTRGQVPDEEYPMVVRRVRDGETLAQVGTSYGVSRQRIHQICCALDPQATALGETVRRTLRRELRQVRTWAAAARFGPCLVCGDLIPQSSGGVTTTTCGPRCSRLYRVAKLHLSEKQHEAHRRATAITVLKRPARYGPAKVEWAQRYLAERPPANRRYAIPGTAVAKALEEIQQFRQGVAS